MLFGKTMENVRNNVDVWFVTHWDRKYDAEAMIAKSNFHSRNIFSENLVAMEMRKLEMKFDESIYVDMCIQDMFVRISPRVYAISYMAPLFRENCKVMYTDTDSLIYYIECDNVYDI